MTIPAHFRVLSEKEGEEYIASKHALVEVTKSLQKFEDRKKDQEERKDVYEKAASLKKLKHITHDILFNNIKVSPLEFNLIGYNYILYLDELLSSLSSISKLE